MKRTFLIILGLLCGGIGLVYVLQNKSFAAENPLLEVSPLPFEAPPFDRIKTEHFIPAFEKGIAEHLEEIRTIGLETSEPTFENTLVPLEKSGKLLHRVNLVFSNLAGANSSDEIRAIEEKINPKLASHGDDISMNADIFKRLDALWSQRETLNLTLEQKLLLEHYRKEAIRAGVNLGKEEQGRIRTINANLSSLETKFHNNLLETMKKRSVIVDDRARLLGLSEARINEAGESAKAAGKPGKFLIEIDNTAVQPILSELSDRSLRKEIWMASVNRALGEEGDVDNRPLVLEIAGLRAEKAKILGYPNYASYILEKQMSGNPEAARDLLGKLTQKVREKTEDEAAKLETAMREDGLSDQLSAWDWSYYAEKVRQKEFEVDSAELKPYFNLESVLKNGVFYVMGKLYGITFEERSDLPVYDPSVRVFNVKDSTGAIIGLFYADYFRRDGKSGGAWMTSLVDQSFLLAQKPVIINVLNIQQPAEGQPALLTLDETVTLFHEMGHGVHGLLSQVEYPTLSGTEVPRDFVEFPSTFNEDWAILPEVLSHYARHYKTGEIIPQELLDKSLAAGKFNQGHDTFEYLAAALLDLEWHSLSLDQIPDNAVSFEKEALVRLGLSYDAIPPRYRTQFFDHIWAGGYSAGYYSYLWSEVLAADAFAFMQENGGLTRENGRAFADAILSKGGSVPSMEAYKNFRGQEPSIDALLKRRGLD